VSHGLLNRAHVRPGHRLLDVATGIGEPALTAAALVGPHGHVVGTDLSAAVIRIAQQRARTDGAGNVIFHVADADQGQPARHRLRRRGVPVGPDVLRRSAHRTARGSAARCGRAAGSPRAPSAAPTATPSSGPSSPRSSTP